ncbi:hypothetical protein CW745_11485 [Psychromonas sp. psych-6C06]|uniref:hypothetical protein n=1 Tax=Psychromonas sp. psych-6C06 TaxID=2058089 RepID=UPI000C31CFCD|nr:hypothetical protein [Psychromonas sp. psych-6C06]PKF61247.1 hypothetical protein CW745_11485 [Psychromonas sp. psych-6C06]
MMKKTVMLLAIFAFLPAYITMAFAEPVEEIPTITIASNSDVEFDEVPNLENYPFEIIAGSFELMNSGETQLLISQSEWTDEQMADYKQRHQSLPIVLTLGAFSDLKEATLAQQAEVFSGRSGDKLLYLYLTANMDKEKKEALGLHFTQTLQAWFSKRNLMVLPEAVQQQNLVALGLRDAQFEGGYK